LFGPGPERTQTNLTGLRRGGIEVSNIRTTTLLERSHGHGTTLKEVQSSRDSEGMTGIRVSVSVSGKFQLEEKSVVTARGRPGMALARRNGALCNITQFPLVDYSPVTGELKGDGACPYLHQKTCHLLFWTRTSEKVEKSTRILE